MTNSSDQQSDEREVVDRKTASKIMKVPIRTLENWAARPKDKPYGPQCWSINARGDTRYYRDECEQWAKTHPK